MHTVRFEQLANFEFSKISNVLVTDDRSSQHGIQIWSARTMAGFRSSTSEGELNDLEQLVVEVDAPLNEEKLAAVLRLLKELDGPTQTGSLISMHEWEEWGFTGDAYPT